MEQEEQDATQRTMDMIKEELNHSIDDEGADDKEEVERGQDPNRHFSK